MRTAVVLAAGLGSRYGGLKQMEPVGPAGELLLDYALFDALQAGFRRAVFVLRRELAEPFAERVLARLPEELETEVVLQELEDLPGGHRPPPGRSKPWGTAHAVWACRGVVRGPFAVLNADDRYGAGALRLMAGSLDALAADPGGDGRPDRFALVAYPLRQTLSPHGPVSRGVCRLGPSGGLEAVVEHTAVESWGDGARARDAGGGWQPLPGDAPVSTNLWGLTPHVFPRLEAELQRFLAEPTRRAGEELYLPSALDALIQAGDAEVAVRLAADRWIGVTHPADRPAVAAAIAELVAEGVYPAPLWPKSGGSPTP